jgi:hypothetical protein
MGMKEGEGMMKIKGSGKINGGQMIKAQINWDGYLKQFDTVQKENLAGSISATILQTQHGIDESILKKYTDNGSKENFIKSATIQLMSTPEYQLC